MKVKVDLDEYLKLRTDALLGERGLPEETYKEIQDGITEIVKDLLSSKDEEVAEQQPNIIHVRDYPKWNEPQIVYTSKTYSKEK